VGEPEEQFFVGMPFGFVSRPVAGFTGHQADGLAGLRLGLDLEPPLPREREPVGSRVR
jgi:hypothetical protein